MFKTGNLAIAVTVHGEKTISSIRNIRQLLGTTLTQPVAEAWFSFSLLLQIADFVHLQVKLWFARLTE
jgi:hypothetical protein